MDRITDLRSDTSSPPTDEMLEAMKNAEVGNDTYGEDQNVTRLQDFAAKLFGKEESLFLSSGTQGNLLAMLSFTSPGDYLVAEKTAHIIASEERSYEFVAGLTPYLIEGMDGIVSPQQIEHALRAITGKVGLISIENPHNRAGGTIVPPEIFASSIEVAHAHKIPVHLDGARIFNAAAALDVTPEYVSRGADSILICLEKGLCAPVGSILIGDNRLITEARRNRKMVGGRVHKSGYLAAAGLVALQEMIDQPKQDNIKALNFARALDDLGTVKVRVEKVQTNIVHFEVSPLGVDSATFLEMLRPHNIKLGSLSPTIVRSVIHRGITEEDLARVVEVIRTLLIGKSSHENPV